MASLNAPLAQPQLTVNAARMGQERIEAVDLGVMSTAAPEMKGVVRLTAKETEREQKTKKKQKQKQRQHQRLVPGSGTAAYTADVVETPHRTLDLRPPVEPTPELQQRRAIREQIPDFEGQTLHKFGRFWSTSLLPTRHQARVRALGPFFTDERVEKTLIPIVSVTSRISLRALDWLVINYSKKHKMVLVTGTSNRIVNVYDTYRSWLWFWRRSMFDAFRRGPRVYFKFGGYTYSTTVAQLNFMYWTEVIGVLRFAHQNIEEIEVDMNTRIAECRAEKNRVKKLGGKRKRAELSKAPKITCSIYNIPSTVNF